MDTSFCSRGLGVPCVRRVVAAVAAIAGAAVVVGAPRAARADDSVGFEVAAKGGVLAGNGTTEPGVGARGGVLLRNLYLGFGLVYYFSSHTEPLPGTSGTGGGFGQAGGTGPVTIDGHTLLYGVEVGYDVVHLPLFSLRPQVGLGVDADGSSCSGNSTCGGSSSTNLYVEPGVTALLVLGNRLLVGADLSAVVVPENGQVFTALAAHGQAGVGSSAPNVLGASRREREVDGGADVQQGRVERRHRAVALAQQERDLRATEDHALRAARDEAFDDGDVPRARRVREDASRELCEDRAVDPGAVVGVRHQRLDAARAEEIRIEGSFHRRARTEQRDAIDALRGDGRRGGLRDVHEGDPHARPDRRRDLVRRVRAQDEPLGAGALELHGGVTEATGNVRPARVVVRRGRLELGEVEREEEELRRVLSAEAGVHLLVDGAVVLDGGEPREAADEPERLHDEDPSIGDDVARGHRLPPAAPTPTPGRSSAIRARRVGCRRCRTKYRSRSR